MIVKTSKNTPGAVAYLLNNKHAALVMRYVLPADPCLSVATTADGAAGELSQTNSLLCIDSVIGNRFSTDLSR